MLAKIRHRIYHDFRTNWIQYAVVFFFLFIGIMAGTFTINRLNETTKNNLVEFIASVFMALKNTDVEKWQVCYNSCLQSMFFFVIIYVSAFWVAGIPIMLFVIAIRGFYLGFSVGILFLKFGLAGFFTTFFCIFFTVFILLPCAIKATVLGMKHALSVFQKRNIPKTARDKISDSKNLLKSLLKIFAVTVAGIVLESFLVPGILKTI